MDSIALNPVNYEKCAAAKREQDCWIALGGMEDNVDRK